MVAAARRPSTSRASAAQARGANGDEQIARNKACFVDEIRAGTLNPIPMTSKDMTVYLMRHHYYKDGENEYDYLLKLNLASLTTDKSAALHAEADKLSQMLRELKNTKMEDVWNRELDHLEVSLGHYEAEQEKVRSASTDDDKKGKKKRAISGATDNGKKLGKTK